ncbi:MAG: hypothetical protein WAM39_02855 [Bryobacteraceae bacterium]
MTICVAALAADGQAIVCVADRSVSYGDDITGESDVTKIVSLGSGAVAMVSGAENEYERVLAKLGRNTNLGKSIPDTINYCEEKYKETRKELLATRILEPNLTDEARLRESASAPTANKYIRKLMEQVSRFELQCSIILCGFDEAGAPYILSLSSPGEVSDLSHLGYYAIGSGWQYATARMVWSEYSRKKRIDEVLWYTLDAKISAEINPFIGGEWDGFVLLSGKKPLEVPANTRLMLDRAWVQHDHSPYYDRKIDDDPWAPPPRDWKDQLRKFSDSILPPSTESATPYPPATTADPSPPMPSQESLAKSDES